MTFLTAPKAILHDLVMVLIKIVITIQLLYNNLSSVSLVPTNPVRSPLLPREDAATALLHYKRYPLFYCSSLRGLLQFASLNNKSRSRRNRYRGR